MAKIQTNIGLADVELNPKSMETSFSATPFEFSASTTVWNSIDFNNAYGTVVVIGNTIAGTTNILFNGANTTNLIDGQTIAKTVNPLTSVSINYDGSSTSSISVSLTANKFAY